MAGWANDVAVREPGAWPCGIVAHGARHRTTRSGRVLQSCVRSNRSRPAWRHSGSNFRIRAQEQYRVEPGQFNMIYVPGVGEVPISVSSIAAERPGIGHTIRFVGRVTRVIGKRCRAQSWVCAVRSVEVGRSKQARGRDVVLVAGGLGLAPLRLVVRTLLAERNQYRAADAHLRSTASG